MAYCNDDSRTKRCFTSTSRHALTCYILKCLNSEGTTNAEVNKDPEFTSTWCDNAITNLELRYLENESIDFEVWCKSLASRFNTDYAVDHRGWVLIA